MSRLSLRRGTLGGRRLLVADSFARADNASSMGSADTGQAWSPQGGSTWGIDTGQAYNATAGSVTTLIGGGQNNIDVTCEITYTSGATLPVLIFRALDQDNRLGAVLDYGVPGLALYKTDAGATSSLASGGATISTGVTYVVRALAIGTSVRLFLDGTELVTYTLSVGDDATQYTQASYSQIGLRGSQNTRWDDLAAYAA